MTFFAAGAMHLAGLAVAAFRRRFPPVTGPDSIVPGVHDAKQLVQNVRYLRGRAAHPDFGKFTYWEKFDYLAEIWGLFVIGLSGLVMWFPEIAARVLPGWAVNASLIFHSYEALLAAGFIFSIHFFNTHLRAEVFPVDTVIFSGFMPADEARERYPGWYRRMAAAGRLEPARPDGRPTRKTAARISVIFVTLGTGMLLLVMSAAIAQVVAYLVALLP